MRRQNAARPTGLREGLLLTAPAKVDETIAEAKRLSASGVPVCINVHIAKTDFREGSISI
jgi:acetolactate synthase-1/2/3 large subunit